ncbi:MAG: FtsQ-type POTRA domain-containing protein [Propionibacteriaceae bacterium]|nr:FtsQ-type POTRA domain-containing protein [Propionibacteriaceae bacterium]
MNGVRDATARIAVRRRGDRRRRWLRWLVAVLVVAALAGAGWVVGFSPALAATTVTVSGADLLTRRDVLTAAAVPVGTPMVQIDTGAVADRVAGLPPVAGVTVTRSWPGTIRIAVAERTPRLAIPAGGGYLLADATGVVFEAVRSAPSGLVVVDASPSDQQVLVDVGTVFSALSPQTAAKVSRLAAPSTDGIELRLKDGTRVIWGSAEDSALKSEVLDALLPLGGSEFNVSAPAFPTRR